MTLPQTTSETKAGSKQVPFRSLLGRWTKILRPLWVIVAILALGLFIAGIPDRYHQLFQAASENEQILADLGLSSAFLATYLTVLDLILVLAHFLIAAILFWRSPTSPMAHLVALALVTTPLAVTEALQTTTPPWDLIASIIIYLGLVTSISLLYLFPDGRFTPRWTWSMAFLWAILNIPAVFFSGTIFSFTTWTRSLEIMLILVFTTSGIYAQIFRYLRVSSTLERQQTKWAVLGLTAAALAPLAHYLNLLSLPSLSQANPPTLFYNLADPAVFKFATIIQLFVPAIITLVLLLFPISFAVATLRYHLFDVEIVLNRTLVYGSLTALIIGLYVIIVGGLGTLFQTQSNVVLAVIATGLIAVLFDPLRARLQRAVNRLMYGERDDPVAVLNQLGKRLEETAAPEETMPIIAKSIQQSLKLPYVAIKIKDGEHFSSVTEVGARRGMPLELPLIYQGESIGLLVVTSRSAGETLSPAEQRLLRNIARQAGPAVHTVQLTADLQRSRERLVTAREEERRRLRRDLHDGLGPQLATLALKIDTARNLLRDDPQSADKLLLELKDQTQVTIVDIRRLVNDLRPPALDQLGLVSAIKEQTATQSGLSGLRITVDGPENLPPLPAAVEVAAYRITLEALTNVVRHAKADECIIQLRIENDRQERLQLSVRDNGRGLPDQYTAGVGLTSMRERAAELGGTCSIAAVEAGGTLVVATLPVIWAEHSSALRKM